jgi:hypothetical protein
MNDILVDYSTLIYCLLSTVPPCQICCKDEMKSPLDNTMSASKNLQIGFEHSPRHLEKSHQGQMKATVSFIKIRLVPQMPVNVTRIPRCLLKWVPMAPQVKYSLRYRQFLSQWKHFHFINKAMGAVN